MKFSRKRRQFTILFVDLLLMSAAVFLSLVLRNMEIPSFSLFLEHLKSFSIVMIVWVMMMYTLNLYNLDVPFSIEQNLLFLFITAVMGTLSGFALFYLFSSNYVIMPKTVLLVYNGTVLVLIYIWRYFYGIHFLHGKNLNRYIFIGYNDTAANLLDITNKHSYVNFSPAAVFDEFLKDRPDNLPESIPFLHTAEELNTFLENNSVKIFVMPSEKIFSSEVRRILFKKLSDKCTFYSLSDFYELLARRIPLGAINESWFLRHVNLEGKLPFNIIKRLTDILISGVLLLVSMVFWPFFALIIKIESKGPVFFTQIREGKNSCTFKLYKFRTMRVEDNTFKPTGINDSRITKFGNFMRKTRIDELPQLLNVLKGDMSLIGPRPERPELSVELEKNIPFYRQRLMVKPGITGWDQVSGEYHSPSVEDTYKKLQYDLYYIKNQSVFLDGSIFFKTIMTVFLRQGR